jgi:broad specificity phosphatase PhoE
MPPAPTESAHAAPTGPPGLHPGFGTSSRLWLLRHAEVAEPWQGVAYGDLDVPLSDAGLRDTERLAQAFGALALHAIVTSPLQRARQLAENVAAVSGAALSVDPRLSEIHRGRWQGRKVSDIDPNEVDAFYADPWTFAAHGGESDADVLARAWPVIEQTLASATDANLLVVAHYNVIRVVTAYALGIPAQASFSLRIDPGRALLLLDAARDETRRIMAPGWILCSSNVPAPTGS